MRLAYIISAYKSPDLLIRLVHRIHTPRSIFLIHVDKRTDGTQYRQMVSGLNDLANVVFLKRHSCHWGDFGHVRATLKGLAYLFENGERFDYVFLLTGQDYPIKSNAYIKSFLTEANGRDFISYYSFPNQSWGGDGGLRRIEKWHFRFLEDWPVRLFHKFSHLPVTIQSKSKIKVVICSILERLFTKRELPGHMKPFGGPGYWCITWKSARYIHQFARDNSEFVRFFKYVDIPDEVFFHTIIMNSPYRRSVVNDDLRCIDISARKGPRIWQKQDFEILSRSKALIARKFDPEIDSEILDLIDLRLLSIPQTCP